MYFLAAAFKLRRRHADERHNSVSRARAGDDVMISKDNRVYCVLDVSALLCRSWGGRNRSRNHDLDRRLVEHHVV